MLPARLDEFRPSQRPQAPIQGGNAFGALRSQRALRPSTARPRDVGQAGENWRGVLLDQLRRRGANFFGV